jgi:hypothetical protein
VGRERAFACTMLRESQRKEGVTPVASDVLKQYVVF